MFWVEFGLFAGPENPLEGRGVLWVVGKVWVLNVESGWFLAGSRLDWRFLG